MSVVRQIGRWLKALGRWVWDHYVPILMTYLPLQAFVNFAVYWDHRDYGFRPLGAGVFLTCLFPVIWLLIYLFCGVIARRNQVVADLRRSLRDAGGAPDDSEGEVVR